jgi:uncharacterized protein
MIAVDTNILVYAHREDAPFHKKAYACIAVLAEGRSSWAIPWPCIHEFFSIVTHAKIYNPPSPISCAVDQIGAWLESPSLVLLSETADHWDYLKNLILAAQVNGPMVHDARIAAICMKSGVSELLTADRDFGRFKHLNTRNPLVS